MNTVSKRKKGLSAFQIIILGFAGVILLGAGLLSLPPASRSHCATPFQEALFTSTSAVCVTGLIVQDTAAYWSVFGQAVILLLIQIGGLGVVTVAAFLTMLAGRRIGLMQRSTMKEAVAAPEVGGVVRYTLFILKATAILEAAGAILLLPVFCPRFGGKGIWMAVFHSISAFCNSGFDLMGTAAAPFRSLTALRTDPLLNITIMLLIVLGGLGFLTLSDLLRKRHHLRQYRLQSKVVLITTALLILVPAVFFFFADYSGLPAGERVLTSLFQAVTPRTAGFNTADLSAMSGCSRGLMIFLMLIGGSPGSTAGGIKTTTLAVLAVNAFATFRRREDPEVFGRRLDDSAVKNAATIFALYGFLFAAGAMILSFAEGLPFGVCLFESASAIGTVGLTLGITPGLGIVSRLTLIGLMFFGRVGGLTLIYAAFSQLKPSSARLPMEKITVG